MASWLRRLAIPVIAGWIALVAFVNVVIPQLEVVEKARSVSVSPAHAPSVVAMKRIGKVLHEFSLDSSAMIVLEDQQSLGVDAHHYYNSIVRQLVADTKHVEHVQDFWGDPVTAPGAQSSNGKAAYVQVYLRGNQGEALSNATPHGELTVYGSSGVLPLRTWIDQLHRSLHLGEPGRLYSELAASWLWLIAVAGVLLWWNRFRRRSERDGAKSRLLTIDLESRGRERTLNWHGVVGIWIVVGLVFLSATGLTWSGFAGANVTDLRAALSWSTPTVTTKLDGSAASGMLGHHAHDGGAGDASTPLASRVAEINRVLKAARDAGIGGDVEVSIPSDTNTAFTVAQTRQPWVMSNNAAAVDGATGRVTDTVWFADWPVAAKLAAWGIQLHMGLLFGIANQILLVGLAVGLVTVIVLGYLLWWRRRPAGGRRSRASTPPRGVLGGLPPGAAAVVVFVAVGVGWFVPLFGVSLAAFVVVDMLMGLRQRSTLR